MQLGARWRVGDTPHRGVPQELHDAIAASEETHAAGATWTLTWLEGRPRVELLSDTGAVLDDVTINASGQVARNMPVSHGSSADGSADAGSAIVADAGVHADDGDDDDWLL